MNIFQGIQLVGGLFFGSMSVYSLLQQAITLAVTFMFCLYAIEIVCKWLQRNHQEASQTQQA